jgi:hypothetical protein
MQICKRESEVEGDKNPQNPQQRSKSREISQLFREFKRMFICHKQNTYMNSQVLQRNCCNKMSF